MANKYTAKPIPHKEELEKLYIPSNLQPFDQFEPLDIPEVTPKKP